jgi:glyceraldehyde 3-phosphate dehydrogenase
LSSFPPFFLIEQYWGYTDLPLVSSDFRGNSRSSTVDGLLTALLCEERMIRVVGWYDNEWGYASRVADLACIIGECERSGRPPDRVRIVERKQTSLSPSL